MHLYAMDKEVRGSKRLRKSAAKPCIGRLRRDHGQAKDWNLDNIFRNANTATRLFQRTQFELEPWQRKLGS